MEWNPDMTQAPKYSLILLYRPTADPWCRVNIGKWNGQMYHKKPRPFWEIWSKIGGDFESRNWHPTHWMPLPDPPR